MRRAAVAGAGLLAVLAAILQPWHDAASNPRPRHAPPPTASPASHAPLLAVRSRSPVGVENRRAGTADWVIPASSPTAVEGFAAPISVSAGQAVRLYVRTTASSVRADVYRMGWYGGTGARRVAVAGPVRGDAQKPCPVSRPRLTIACDWRPSLRIATGPDWVSGEYLAKLTDTNGDRSYVPFTVTERSPRAPILMVLGVTTWQAYNMWGGRDLYLGPATPAPCKHPCPTRSRAASFDRPYVWPGAGLLFSGELQAIDMLESQGLDVAYATSVDLDRGTVALERRRVFLSVAHDEYYSTRMRNALERAIAGGTSLAFLGANDLYRHIRFEASPLGADRIEVNYKFGGEDPISLTNPSESTADYRRPPLDNPEQLLMGQQYDCCACLGVGIDWTPTFKPAWLFRGTGLVSGVPVQRLIQGEYDRIFTEVPRPAGVVVVGKSSMPACGKGKPHEQSSTIYIAPSGGAVFDAGDEYFACTLGPTRIGKCADKIPDTRIERLTLNLLRAMLRHHYT